MGDRTIATDVSIYPRFNILHRLQVHHLTLTSIHNKYYNTYISVCLYKEEVRWYSLSLSVAERICVVTGSLCQYKVKSIEVYS